MSINFHLSDHGGTIKALLYLHDQTDKYRLSSTNRQVDTRDRTQTDRQTDEHTDRNRQIDRQTVSDIFRQKERQTDRDKTDIINKQLDRQIDKRVNTHIPCIYVYSLYIRYAN